MDFKKLNLPWSPVHVTKWHLNTFSSNGNNVIIALQAQATWEALSNHKATDRLSFVLLIITSKTANQTDESG
jgi:hypothetical protein